ncbi:TPA: hypothetical protein SMV75_001918 [Proteus mirabilis]|uniref:hypothetical protein n=3 Tax=Proteus mirabilis TaxID=584 RepID=UPI000B4029F8|nr:hypothetical protein [Proteus mirabilis]ARX09381.1 hypothetical protein AM405_11145 [Proteus mirabilis]PXA27079.1 hypothetical protein DMB99_09700 [Proteus mirabilis]HCT5873614.1 hypothetical protein [Proteus mirabilis]HCT8174113.1 hypothetical protein [Proteus mirabilis]HEH1608571.1 hypothetical protein [Proteus mirabilis]
MNTLFIITNYKNIFPQKTHETNGLDLKKINRDLESHNIKSKIYCLDDLTDAILENRIIIEGNYFLFCSSQIEEYKNTIIDIAYEIMQRKGILIPKIDFYISHENKYFQELYKNRYQIKTPKSKILSTSELPSLEGIKLPCVVKKYSGFGSRGIDLAQNTTELKVSILKKMNSYWLLNTDIYESIKRLIKAKIKFKNLYPKKFGRVVLQELIPNLAYDWKILVFDDYVFALKRYTRKNDFKASGSGLFDFNATPSDSLIKFSVETRIKLDTPFISLDIAEDENNEFSIIEYQAIHFGLTTALKCHQYYFYNNGTPKKIPERIDSIESLFSKSIVNFIEKNKF